MSDVLVIALGLVAVFSAVVFFLLPSTTKAKVEQAVEAGAKNIQASPQVQVLEAQVTTQVAQEGTALVQKAENVVAQEIVKL
jgi:uncharacterized protein YjeT (DUF2065 family)